MTTWTPEQLTAFDRAGEIRVAGRRADGSPRTLTIVWHVVVDGALYLRSVRGPEGQWYRGVARTFEGFVELDGETSPVSYALDASRDDAIDRAYVEKYGNGSATRSITAPIARETTMIVTPRDA